MTLNTSETLPELDSTDPDPRASALAAMHAVAVDATGIVGFATAGRVLVVGSDSRALSFAQRLSSSALHPMLVLLDAEPLEIADGYPVFEARRNGFELSGHMGAFNAVLSPEGRPELFDLVVDFCLPPLFGDEWSRHGYHQVDDGEDTEALVRQLEDEVGEFEKPRYFAYDADLCVRGRSGMTGCNRCVEACPAGAITGLAERIEVDPYLCQGGGICATVCPGGALQYRYPSVADTIERVRRLITAFRDAGGQHPQLLIHDEQSQPDLDRLPGNLLPFAVEEVASVGIEFWLAALSFGARSIELASTPRLVAASADALEIQLDNARGILAGLGYSVDVIRWRRDDDAMADEMPDIEPAAFAAAGTKREILFLAVDHLASVAPEPVPEIVPLPATAPLGEILVDAEKCTLCVSCATVCPRGAVTAEEDRPALVFFEGRCVQCGLCEQACPENAITLIPRLLTNQAERTRRRVLHEEPPFECIKCGKAFATRASIESVLARLEGHSMFGAEAARNRLKMCGDCRVVDMLQEDGAN